MSEHARFAQQFHASVAAFYRLVVGTSEALYIANNSNSYLDSAISTL